MAQIKSDEEMKIMDAFTKNVDFAFSLTNEPTGNLPQSAVKGGRLEPTQKMMK